MACNNCSSNGGCNCQGTSYRVPSNAVYGNSTCRQPAEPCDAVVCAKCVRNCHVEDKWCVTMNLFDNGGADGIQNVAQPVEFCIHRGERLDQMLQKLTLAQDDPSAYKFKVKNFYINGVTGGSNPTIEFIWYEFDNAVDGISLAYASANSDDCVVPILKFAYCVLTCVPNALTWSLVVST